MNLSKQEFLNRTSNDECIKSKSELRESLEQGVEEFLANKANSQNQDEPSCKKLTFDDQLNILLFACYAKEPFSTKDIQDAVVDAHRTTINSQLQNFIEWRYFEKLAHGKYVATQYAKEIMNVMGSATA